MESGFLSVFLLPAGLGLLGFVEPCTIGGHLIFLQTQKARARAERWRAIAAFVVARAAVAGLFGAGAALLGQRLIAFQSGLWLVFGLAYLLAGLALMRARARWMRLRIALAPGAWWRAASPLLLGLAFGLGVPACAAPILFVLLGLGASTGAVAAGFAQMAVFGLFLSLPLALFVALPGLVPRLEGLGRRLGDTRRLLGAIFFLLGLWSVWFGLYVDPADWAGLGR